MEKNINKCIQEFEKFYTLLMQNAPENYIPWFFPCKSNRKDPSPAAILKIDSLSKGSWHHESARLSKDRCIEHIKAGNNIGISARKDDILIIGDIDDGKYFDQLPKNTLTVTSRRRQGWHFFGWNKDDTAKINLPTEFGEMRSDNQYVLAPGSFVPTESNNNPNAGYYTVKETVLPRLLSFDDLPQFFKDKQRENIEIETKIKQKEEFKGYTGGKYDDLFKLKVSDIVGLVPQSKRLSHPLHESETRSNFSLSSDGSLGHCWRHMVSLNAVQYLCVEAGYAACEDAGTPHKGRGLSKIRGDKQALEVAYKLAVEKGLIKQRGIIETTEDLVKQKEKENKNRIEIKLPKSGRLISSFINDISHIISEENILFFRNDSRQVVEVGKINNENEKEQIFTGFIAVKPSRFITLVEKFFIPGNHIAIKKEDSISFEFKSKSMTKDLANTVLDSYILEESLPNINRIFTIPIPIIHERELTFPKVGYDIRFKSWLPFNAPKIINTKLSLKESKDILYSIIKEFCFQTNYDYNIAIAGLITPFLRGLYHSFNCRTPVFIYLANRERVGKDYLAGINGIIYEGIALEEPPISIAKNKGNADDELRKKVLSALLSGRKRLHFSNNKGYINNAVFEGIVTAKTYSDRLLGKNETPIFDNELEFSLSGNIGIGFTPDLANRSRVIRLFYDKEDTNTRMFDNPNLHKWIMENRNLILSAIYGIVRNWFENGCKAGTVNFASFPEWARVCGGIMEAAGYDSPCKPSEEDLALGGDSETTDMKLLFEYCYEENPDTPLTKSEIKELIESEDIFSYLDFSKKADQSSFGKKIVKFIGRVLSNIRMRVVDNSVRSSRQKYIFTKEVSEYEDKIDGNIGSLGNFGAIGQQKSNSVYSMVGKTLPALPKLPLNKVHDYIKSHKECTFMDIISFLKLKEEELSEILNKLKKSGQIFEPKPDKYVIV